MEWLIIFGYSISLLIVCLFSLEQLTLALLYGKGKAARLPAPPPLISFPAVTVQLPVYNERYVVERLIDSVCRLDYPKDRLEIQVLDDSTDITIELIRAKVEEWSAKGANIHHILRPDRTGFKAGALQHGLQHAKGEFIAIFDADFLPEPDFLLRTLPSFEAETGLIQTRWGHINQDYSLLTRMQAFGLNAHFSVEQSGRNGSGKFMNFNGTAGVWRKSCIVQAGGWHFDTLTEDLDLSYRAQLGGWKFKYLEDVVSPGELPVLVPAIKSQQYRWNKGAAETARKNIGLVLKSPFSFQVKLHALLHLLNSSVFLFLLLAAILSVPMLYIKAQHPAFAWFFNAAGVFFIGFIAMAVFYWTSARATMPSFTLQRYVSEFFLFLTFTMGLALHNTLAVVEGYLGIKTPFVRTPKYNIRSRQDSWKGNVYLQSVSSPITVVEGLLAVYFFFGMWSGIRLHDYGLLFFHLMLTLGFGFVFFLSLKPSGYAKTGV